MDNSQSSDLFSETSGNLHEAVTIDIEAYGILLMKIKSRCNSFSGEKSLPESFAELLDDCKSCILQCLDIMASVLIEEYLNVARICHYIEDVVCVLQLLSNFMKTILESISLTCRTIKNFGTSTGIILLSVFKHCKNSESIYGNSLKAVQIQLKDLFRNCHELQLTYLMALEKHLIFDLTEKEDQNILVKTLVINLKIGDVVQSLDVKTMAEQWKAITMLCEKYSELLLEKNIFNISTKILVSSIENNVNTALEAKEDKIIIRSLKVANFSLKIILRICNIFKDSLLNNYEHIVRLLMSISLCKGTYYEVTAKKSSEFSQLLTTHLSMPTENVISALLKEEKFMKVVLSTEGNQLRDTQILGYVTLITSLMKALMKRKDVQNDIKGEIINRVFSLLPYCHKWFNIGLKFEHISGEGKVQYYGLYEHLLIHTIALSSTFTPEEYSKLEYNLYEALLGTEYYTALFSSNLWIVLCRIGDSELHYETLLGLIKIYQKLKTHPSFPNSPQKIHFTFTIEKLYQTLDTRKLEIYKHFNVRDIDNVELWCALKIYNSHEASKQMERVIADKLLKIFNDVINDVENVENLIKYMKLASTCTFLERSSKIEDFIYEAWLKACPNCHNVLQSQLNAEFVSFFRYLEGLVSLTNCYLEKFDDRTNLIKILNIISNILLTRNVEVIPLLFKLFYKLTDFLLENRNDQEINTIFMNTLKNILDNDNKEQYIIKLHIYNLTEPILKEISMDFWKNYREFERNLYDFDEWQKQLDSVSNYQYIHKCIPYNEVKKPRTFDIGDIDSLFGEYEEPLNKKPKFDVENLISLLENNVEKLCHYKGNILCEEVKRRINVLCDKLKNIVS